MNSRETLLLRTKLRQVNMEYSALVRHRTSERRFVRMDELRIERLALMNLLFGGANSKRCRLVSQSDVVFQQLAEMHRERSEHVHPQSIVKLANDVPLQPTALNQSEGVSS
jgi:hypothetical protein